MQTRTGFLTLIAILLALSTLTQAATSGPYVTSTPIPSTLTDWTGSLAFPKFNPSLGTLTSVTIGLSTSIRVVMTVTNSSLDPSSGTARTEVQFTVQDAGWNLITPEIDSFTPSFAYSLGPGDSVTSGTLTKSGSSTDLYTDAAILAEFIGPGTIVLPASTFTQIWLSNAGGDTLASQITNASLTGTVTYEYTLGGEAGVPEPGSMLLFGSALIGLTILLRSRLAPRLQKAVLPPSRR